MRRMRPGAERYFTAAQQRVARSVLKRTQPSVRLSTERATSVCCARRVVFYSKLTQHSSTRSALKRTQPSMRFHTERATSLCCAESCILQQDHAAQQRCRALGIKAHAALIPSARHPCAAQWNRGACGAPELWPAQSNCAVVQCIAPQWNCAGASCAFRLSPGAVELRCSAVECGAVELRGSACGAHGLRPGAV